MELLEQTNVFIATVIRVLIDGTIERWMQDAVSSVSRFWSTDPTVASGLALAQLFAAFISAIFVFFIVVGYLRRKAALATSTRPVGEEAVQAEVTGPLRERWNEVLSHLDSAQEAQWKVAVIEADKLVDDAMTRTGFAGETFGDRLTNIEPGMLVSLDGLWWAHKIRNRVAHEMDYFLRYTDARQAIGYYQQALEELQLL
jgi:hypothetical protein